MGPCFIFVFVVRARGAGGGGVRGKRREWGRGKREIKQRIRERERQKRTREREGSASPSSTVAIVEKKMDGFRSILCSSAALISNSTALLTLYDCCAPVDVQREIEKARIQGEYRASEDERSNGVGGNGDGGNGDVATKKIVSARSKTSELPPRRRCGKHSPLSPARVNTER